MHIDPTLPEALNTIVRRMLEKKQDDRYQTVDELMVAITECCREIEVPLRT
jgi:hypothetical protein